MENLIWAVVLWLLVLILIPLDRIKQLYPIAILSFVLLFALNYTFVQLGYYQFTKFLVLIAGVPPFHVLGGAGGGVLLLNWLPRSPLNKVLYITGFTALLSLSAYVFGLLEVIVFLRGFDHFLDFIVNLAGLSVLVWLSIALVGQERIYEGNKTRFSSLVIK